MPLDDAPVKPIYLVAMYRALTIGLFLYCCAAAVAKEAATDQAPPYPQVDAKPIGGGKTVTTTIIKRCPDGYELVMRVNGQLGCAKNIVPVQD